LKKKKGYKINGVTYFNGAPVFVVLDIALNEMEIDPVEFMAY
jgi:hypothetical protein